LPDPRFHEPLLMLGNKIHAARPRARENCVIAPPWAAATMDQGLPTCVVFGVRVRMLETDVRMPVIIE